MEELLWNNEWKNTICNNYPPKMPHDSAEMNNNTFGFFALHILPAMYILFIMKKKIIC